MSQTHTDWNIWPRSWMMLSSQPNEACIGTHANLGVTPPHINAHGLCPSTYCIVSLFRTCICRNVGSVPFPLKFLVGCTAALLRFQDLLHEGDVFFHDP